VTDAGDFIICFMLCYSNGTDNKSTTVKKTNCKSIKYNDSINICSHIGVGAQSTLGGQRIFARKICIKNQQNARILHDSCRKNYQNTRIFMIFARKNYKIPEFYMIFARKMPEFYIIIARKIFSRILGGHVPPCPPSPTPMFARY